MQSLVAHTHPLASSTNTPGGDFAFLSRDQELVMYIKVHLRAFAQTRFSAGADFDFSSSSAAAAAAAAK